ncbi:GNAT family N-acetyltransferase [Frankia sp. Cpl3]|uniref:GNAT family N-acetyltransferase n=1 Tax=Parafrankia colletiae TaxID=573497 RepID=UPI000A0496CF|nr:GNAT family protein [Parafrankia colletiae]MCK9899643.1 GNAT family N-acetyltransferase [Frankia sp. Cpl3]
MISADEFADRLSKSVSDRFGNADFGARLGADLGLDSYSMLEVYALLAEMGVELQERDWLSVGTLGDLYSCYRAAASGGMEPGPPVDLPSGSLRASGRIGSPGPHGSSSLLGPVQPMGSPAAPQSARQPLLPVDPRLSVVDSSRELPGALQPPQRAGRFFRLAPVLPPAHPFLYELAVSPDVGFRWRYRGSVPSYAQFEQELWPGMIVQFLVESLQTGEPAGNVICYNPDLGLGHAYVGAAMAGRYSGSGIAIEPVVLFTQYLFDVYPFRKLYFELPEFNLEQFGSAVGDRLRLEGRLIDHDYYRGRYWDRVILALYRDEPLASLHGRDADRVDGSTES